MDPHPWSLSTVKTDQLFDGDFSGLEVNTFLLRFAFCHAVMTCACDDGSAIKQDCSALQNEKELGFLLVGRTLSEIESPCLRIRSGLEETCESGQPERHDVNLIQK